MLAIGDWSPAAISDLSLHSLSVTLLHCPSAQGTPRTFAWEGSHGY